MVIFIFDVLSAAIFEVARSRSLSLKVLFKIAGTILEGEADQNSIFLVVTLENFQ